MISRNEIDQRITKTTDVQHSRETPYYIVRTIYSNFEMTQVDLSGLGATKPLYGLAWLDLGPAQLRSRLGAKSRQH
jgi:hypothetical protein